MGGVRRSDLVLCRREELGEETFYAKWLECGVSFFRYMSVFQNMQTYMRRNVARFRQPNPAGFDYLTSVEIRPNTRAFAAAATRCACRPAPGHPAEVAPAGRPQGPRLRAARRAGAGDAAAAADAGGHTGGGLRPRGGERGLGAGARDAGAAGPPALHLLPGTRGFAFAARRLHKERAAADDPREGPGAKAVLKEFEEFAASFTELAELGFGKLPPAVFWEGVGSSRYPRFGKIALRLSLIPSKLDVTKSISILRTYAAKQFKLFYGDPKAMEKVQNVINMFSVDYYSLYDEESHQF